jgi:cell division protein FtsX
MDVVMMLSSEAARTLRERTLSAETEQIRELAAKSGGSLEALHPDSDDPKLMRYFFVRAKDGEQAEQLARALRSSKAIEAVYVKPAGEAPS